MRKTTKIIWFGHRNQVGLQIVQKFTIKIKSTFVFQLEFQLNLQNLQNLRETWIG